jgi:hypothetical protein
MSDFTETSTKPIEPTTLHEQPEMKPSRYFKVYSELTPEQVEKRRAYMREYQRRNPDKIKKAQSKYFATFGNLKEYRAKAYRDSATQQKIISCECGSNVKHHSMQRHLQTQKHINFMNTKTES